MDIPSTPVTAELFLKLRDAFQIRDFVETGTYLGATANWASQNFQKVYTVEASKELWKRAVDGYASIANIEFLHGDSRTALSELLPRLVLPAIFWLDAHWSAGITFGEHDECPLLGELEALQGSLKEAFVFIDDANLFLSPPPRPNSIDAWPDIYTILHLLKHRPDDNYVLVFENVVISVPAYARSCVAAFCQDVNTRRFEQKVRAERAFLNRVFFRLRRKLEHTFPALKAK